MDSLLTSILRMRTARVSILITRFCLAISTSLLVSVEGCAGYGNAVQHSGSETEAQHGYVPPDGFVPTAAVAVEVARAVLVPIYGSANVQRQLPFSASLQGDRWIVEGSLPAGSLGGVARVELTKADGRIVRVTHGR